MDPHYDILLKCAACGFVTASLKDPVDVQRLYGDQYFQGEEYLDYKSDEAFFKRHFQLRLQDILRRKASGKLLEIGAAYGFFLDLAKQYFDVVGFEVNREGVRHARDAFGVNVHGEDFLNADERTIGAVDVTVMWDVVEHLDRPDRFLTRIAQLSRPGALLYVTTGDIGSLLARWRGRSWRMIHPPTHVHYFSRTTLTRLLNQCGFRVLEIRAVPVARSVQQILHSILVLRMDRPRLYEACKRWVPATWGFTINTFDIMQAVAERDACEPR
jgi:SAM-dependent methyltransferase